MNLKFLETFVWVARLKSFRLTADKLFTTQASISSRIAVLEGELGVKLFLRDSRGVSLTPEGLKVLDYAEHLGVHAVQAITDLAAPEGAAFLLIDIAIPVERSRTGRGFRNEGGVGRTHGKSPR